jgi:maltose alpha-D-glucosyltransferase/alpha-amylase
MAHVLPEWLETAVVYEIYPQSFYDSNGDGIGDLPGIAAKLDYVSSLGCDAVWLNPCFVSPFQDAGYDVADYYKVAPRYGTNADMKRLLREAGRRGIRVMLDLVPGHTSIEHPWFRESCRPEKNKYTNWYIWTDSVWNQDVPGHRTVSGYCNRDGCYVTNFFHFQPALNYGFARPDPGQPWQLPVDHPDCAAVREEMKNVMRFWLDMGASGFRVDMAGSLIKGDRRHRETRKLWDEVRDMLDTGYPDAVLVSEWGDPVTALRVGFHMDFLLPWMGPAPYAAYRSLWRSGPQDSYFSRVGAGDITAFTDYYPKALAATRRYGYICIPSGNHDISRMAEGRTRRELKVAFAFLLTLPGVPYIYYGDEIGMACPRRLVSREGGYNRTSYRTPMQWTRGRNAGFSTAPEGKLYLPVDARRTRPSVESQDADRRSLLNCVRDLLRLRRSHAALCARGDFVPLYAKKRTYPFVYLRRRAGRRVLVAVNPSGRDVSAAFPAAGLSLPGEPLMVNGTSLLAERGRAQVKMKGVSFGIFKV